MIGEICYWVFNMSIIATVMGLIVMLLRKIKAIPRRIFVFLWVVPFIRMVSPVGLSSPYSLMTLISKFTTRTVTVYAPTDFMSFTISNSIMAAADYSPITYKVNILDTVFKMAGAIWVTVAVAILITLAIIYATTLHAIRDAKPLKGNVFVSDKVDSPAVYGVLRPRIVLPANYSEENEKYILAHENAHIRRKDNLWRLLGFIAAGIHWLNPFSWIFLKAFLADLELACDENAIAGYDVPEQKQYARVLLSCSQSKDLFVSAFGGAKVRTRIENILSYKQMTAFSAIGFTVLIMAIIVTLVTNA
jgi:beta-lactamase regulating signal transducer with metallopeptidase domain